MRGLVGRLQEATRSIVGVLEPRAFRVALLVPCAVLGLATGVGAQVTSFEAGSFFPATGPRLAGEDVAWVERGRRGGYVLVRRSLAAGEPRRLRRVPRPAPGKVVSVSLAAGAQHTLLYEISLNRVPDNPSFPSLPPPPDVLSVSNVGVVESLAEGCESCSRDLDFSGSVGLFPVEGGTMLRDFASPPAFEPMTVPQASFNRVAGDYVVETIRTGARVVDWRRGEEAYRLEGITPDPSSFRSVDVQPDGKIAFAYVTLEGGRAVGRVGWASPAEPFEHRLAVTGSVNELRLDGDRVVFSRSRPAGAGKFVQELGSIGLTGPEQVLERSSEAPYRGGSFDYDGSRVAWVERGCDGPLVVSAALAELLASPRIGVRRGCRLQLASRPRLARNERLVFGLGCEGFTLDCSHANRVVRTARAYRVAGRRVARGTKINVGSRGVRKAGRVRLRLTRTGRRLLARRSPVRLRISLTLSDQDSGGFSDTYRQRRTTTASVR